MQMLTHLYGIHQEQQQAPLKQQQLELQNKMAEYNLGHAPAQFADEQALHQAQIAHLGQENLSSLYPYLGADQQKYIFDQKFPGYHIQQDKLAADKLTRQRAEDEADRLRKTTLPPETPGQGLGAGIHNAVTGFPSWLQGVDSGMTDKGAGFWQGFTGWQPDVSQEPEAKQFLSQAAQMPNQPTHDPLGDWLSTLFGGMTGPKKTQPAQYTPTPVR